MPHDTPLIATIVAGLCLAFLCGLLAHRLRLPAIAGYLFAGIVIGPFTPGYVADQHLASELAEIGVILLMFGVGLHFSLKDLMEVRAIAIPGALGQILFATGIGAAFGWAMGWGWGGGLVFGLSLSVASTVVLLRALQERRLVETRRGRIAVGWLIVEDLVMVVALVLIPPLAGLLGGAAQMPEPDLVTEAVAGPVARIGLGPIATTLALTALQVAAFVALMLVVGRRAIPWVLHYVAHTGSRELFRLAVLAIALGVAFGSAALFDVSFALGAFFAGMVMAGSPLSSQATAETLPLRDAFAVLFFVSVGMLFNPLILIEDPFAVLLVVLVVVVAKSAVAYGIVRAFGHGRETALTIAASLAQIGEFSFILIVLGTALDILPAEAKDLTVAGALISILLNTVLFKALDRWSAAQQARAAEAASLAAAAEAAAESQSAAGAEAPPPPAAAEEAEDEPPEAPTALSDHAILIGYGRVGRRVAAALQGQGMPVLVVEDAAPAREAARAAGIEAFAGLGQDAALLALLNVGGARCAILAIPDAIEAGAILGKLRALAPGLPVFGRSASDAETEHLAAAGADAVVMGEAEIARGLASAALAVPPAPGAPDSAALDSATPDSAAPDSAAPEAAEGLAGAAGPGEGGAAPVAGMAGPEAGPEAGPAAAGPEHERKVEDV